MILLNDVPIGANVVVNHDFILSEPGYWGKDNETIKVTVLEHFGSFSTKVRDEIGRVLWLQNERSTIIE